MSLAALSSLRAELMKKDKRETIFLALTAIDVCISSSSLIKDDFVDLFEICGPLRESAEIAKLLDDVEGVAIEEFVKAGDVFHTPTKHKFESPTDEVRARLRAWHVEYIGKGGK